MSEILNYAIESIMADKLAFCRIIANEDAGAGGAIRTGFSLPKCAAPLFSNSPGKIEEDRWVKIKWQNEFTTKNRMVYYGSGPKDEYRLTDFDWGFPFFKEDDVGDLLILVRHSKDYYKGFILQSDQDVEDFFYCFNISPTATNQLIDVACGKSLSGPLDDEMEEVVSRFINFPTTDKMSNLARQIYNKAHNITDREIRNDPDDIILKWADTEFSLFKKFEQKVYANYYLEPLGNLQSLISAVNVITNRRSSRAGRSLELHLSHIFKIAKLEFEEQVITEDNKKPDFIFPGGDAYHDSQFPTEDLIFLGAKTTCRDRWRQVLNEADRIKTKYLFTLQPGITRNQLLEMKHAHLKLVVPAAKKPSFDAEFHPEIMTLSSFIEMVKETQRRSF